MQMREERQYEESEWKDEDEDRMSSLPEEDKSTSLDQLLSKAIRDKNAQKELSGKHY